MTSLPKTMKAVILTGHGGLDKLEYTTDYPTPSPNEGELVIKVGACGLNNTDINTRTAWYSEPVNEGITLSGGARGFSEVDAESGSWSRRALTFPRIQGADVAGEIVDVGKGVDTARVGQRVMVDPWLLAVGEWRDTARSIYFGSECDGGYAEYTKVRSENAIAIDSVLSDAELATFPCAYTTAENLVSRTALKPGETVVISGASGGVGTAAIQLCRLRGARIIAVASISKADSLADLGADQIIDRNSDDLKGAILDAARGRVDVVLDVVGGEMFMPLINALKQGGYYSSSGCIASPLVSFDLRQLVYKDLQLNGATIVPAGTMRRLVYLIEQQKLKPILAKTFQLQDLADAQYAFIEKNYVGNIVVVNE